MKLKGQCYRIDLISELYEYMEFLKFDQNYLNYEFEEIIEELELFIKECKNERLENLGECNEIE